MGMRILRNRNGREGNENKTESECLFNLYKEVDNKKFIDAKYIDGNRTSKPQLTAIGNLKFSTIKL